MHWPAGTLPYELPFTLGHEVAGIVAALGPGADGLEVGEPVLVYGPWGCGALPRLQHRGGAPLRGDGIGAQGGLGRDGGLADYMVVPSPRLTVPIAGSTPWPQRRSPTRRLPVPRDPPRAAAAAAGGEGGRDRHRGPRPLAVQLLKALSPARVVAVDRRDEALELARPREQTSCCRPPVDRARSARAAGGRGARS